MSKQTPIINYNSSSEDSDDAQEYLPVCSEEEEEEKSVLTPPLTPTKAWVKHPTPYEVLCNGIDSDSTVDPYDTDDPNKLVDDIRTLYTDPNHQNGLIQLAHRMIGIWWMINVVMPMCLKNYNDEMKSNPDQMQRHQNKFEKSIRSKNVFIFKGYATMGFVTSAFELISFFIEIVRIRCKYHTETVSVFSSIKNSCFQATAKVKTFFKTGSMNPIKARSTTSKKYFSSTGKTYFPPAKSSQSNNNDNEKRKKALAELIASQQQLFDMM
jgi:hypothetical protein